MKKIILGLGLIIATLFSCSSDDDASSNAENPIVGEWQTVSFIGRNGDIVEASTCEKLATLTIDNDGAFTSTSHTNVGKNEDGSDNCEPDEPNSGTYIIEGDSITVVVNEVTSIGKFTIESGKLTITRNDNSTSTIYKRK